MTEDAVRIRAAAPADVARVWAMLGRLAEYEKLSEFVTGSEEKLAAALFGQGPRLDALVAESGEELVGYALFYPVFGSFRTRWRLWLEDLFVEPAHRGTGAGRLLLAGLARVAVARDCASVDWEVLDWNVPALGFYERLGASRIAADWYRYRLDEGAMRRMAAESGA